MPGLREPKTHKPINWHLRGIRAGSDEAKTHIAELDKAFEGASLPERTTVYRGLSGLAAKQVIENPPKKGEVGTDKGFMSTSREPSVAGKFMASSSHNVMLKIVAPAGAKAIDIAKYSDAPGEKEVLFDRGSRYRVVKFDRKTRTLEVEMIGSGKSDGKSDAASDAARDDNIEIGSLKFVYTDPREFRFRAPRPDEIVEDDR